MMMNFGATSQYLTYHVLIHGKDFPVHVPYEIAVKLDWGTVIKTAIRHYTCQELASQTISKFAGVKIVGVLDMQTKVLIPVEHRIPTTARNLLNISNPRYSAIMLGPVHLLTDKLIQKAFSEYACTVKSLSTLCRVSMDFRRLFMSDFLWKDIEYPYADWLGYGRDGAEEHIWRLVRTQQGLTTFGSYRLRWHSHNTSRMVLFYGKVPTVMTASPDAPGVIEKMSQLFLITKPQATVNKVSIVGGKDAVKFIHQLHFTVPSSATSFHLSKQCTTLLPHGKLVDIEASPQRSKSRRLPKDPGTRVETNGQGDMLFRRLGDDRLTFFQVDYGTPNARFNYVSWVSLCQGVVGHIVVVNALDYGVDAAHHELDKVLTNLLRRGMCTVPVLIMIGVHSSELHNNNAVRHIAKAIMEPNMTNCPWYVQPYNAMAPVGGLRDGYLAGINWMLRNILLQKSVAY